MREILNKKVIEIPDDVTVDVKNGCIVTVTGKLGTIKKDFSKHKIRIKIIDKELVFEIWFSKRKRSSIANAVSSHVKNMIIGVQKGFVFKMKFVYAHFPINATISKGGKEILLKKFLGERDSRLIKMEEGVIVKNTENKDEIAIEGIDLEKVSRSATAIHVRTKVRNKDIRKFLDGIYVSEKLHQIED